MNDGKKVEIGSHQVMRCIMCYDNVVNIPNSRTKERRGLITYYKTYGIIALNKHVDANHYVIAKKFQKEINNEITKKLKKICKKKTKCPSKCNFFFVVVNEPFKIDNTQHTKNYKTLAF